MFKGFVLGIVVVILVGFLGGFAAVKMGVIPANADATPSYLERWIAGTSLNAAVTRDTAGMQDPLQPTDDNVLAGIKLYGMHCAVCHSDASKKPTYVGYGLYQKAPRLGGGGVTDDPDAETYWMITHGVRLTGMPSFSKTLNDTQRWQIALFLKNMNQLSPKAQAAWKKITAPVLPEEILRTLPRFRRPEAPPSGAPG
jgi:thiosulfate dehydrogenase